MSAKAKYMRWASQAAHQNGVPVGIFMSMISHESRWNPRARSPVGAKGIAQFMPGTARDLGINPNNPRQALFAAAKYLASKIHRYKSVELALASYNAGDGAVQKYGGIPPYAETQDYVRNIMRDASNYKHFGRETAPAPAGTPGTPGYTVTAPNAPDLAGVALASLGQMSDQGGHYDPLYGLSNLVQAIQEAGTSTTHVPGTPGKAPAPAGDWSKFVRLRPGADREGTPTVAGVKQFVGELGIALGRPLTITTGSQHNQYVVGTRRQSAHWVGRAADIEMRGKALTRAGQRALILAGMSPKKARKIRGGLFNIGGYQIIFNTNEGGNHFNHLHVGLRG